jgi:hypothetical protein
MAFQKGKRANKRAKTSSSSNTNTCTAEKEKPKKKKKCSVVSARHTPIHHR